MELDFCTLQNALKLALVAWTMLIFRHLSGKKYIWLVLPADINNRGRPSGQPAKPDVHIRPRTIRDLWEYYGLKEYTKSR